MQADPEKINLQQSQESAEMNEDEEFQFFVVRKDQYQDEKGDSSPLRSCKPVGKDDRIMKTETGE